MYSPATVATKHHNREGFSTLTLLCEMMHRVIKAPRDEIYAGKLVKPRPSLKKVISYIFFGPSNTAEDDAHKSVLRVAWAGSSRRRISVIGSG